MRWLHNNLDFVSWPVKPQRFTNWIIFESLSTLALRWGNSILKANSLPLASGQQWLSPHFRRRERPSLPLLCLGGNGSSLGDWVMQVTGHLPEGSMKLCSVPCGSTTLPCPWKQTLKDVCLAVGALLVHLTCLQALSTASCWHVAGDCGREKPV